MRSVMAKSAMTPSLIGRIATIFPGVRPTMRLASTPTANTVFDCFSIATTEGSLRTMPFPRTYTSVVAVPKSMAKSLENHPRISLNPGMSPPCGKTVDSENADQSEARSALPTYIGTPFVKIKKYRENVQECVWNQEAPGFFHETKILIKHSGSGNSHISIWTEYNAREDGCET